MQHMRFTLSIAMRMSDELNGSKWEVGPSLHPRSAMRLSEAVFWDFQLTPHKVRTEQEQKAGGKHFKQQGRGTERAAALRGESNR